MGEKKLIDKSKQDCFMEWKNLYLYKTAQSSDYFAKIVVAEEIGRGN